MGMTPHEARVLRPLRSLTAVPGAWTQKYFKEPNGNGLQPTSDGLQAILAVDKMNHDEPSNVENQHRTPEASQCISEAWNPQPVPYHHFIASWAEGLGCQDRSCSDALVTCSFLLLLVRHLLLVAMHLLLVASCYY